MRVSPQHSPKFALSHRFAGLRYLAWSAAIQCIAYTCAVFAGHAVDHFRVASLQGVLWLLLPTIHATAAYSLAAFARLPPAWKWGNVLAAAALIVGPRAPSATSYAVGIMMLILLLIYLPTFWTRVPYFPTSTPMYEEIAGVLPTDSDFHFVDLGCGFGKLLTYLAAHFPRGTFHGYEIGILPYIVANARALLLGRGRVHIFFKSFWRQDFHSYTHIYAFLAPGPMPALWDKVQREARGGTVFMTNTFRVDAAPDEVRPVEDARCTVLYVHRL